MGFLEILAAALALVCFVQAVTLVHASSLQADSHECNVTAASRCSFPQGFVFGTASAAYQNEGAAAEGGRTPSIWDTFSETSGKITDGSNAAVASDEFHRYKEDVQLMKDMGMDAYRFSIAWPRIYPNGGDKVNSEGIAYYNALIDELLAQGIQPYVTLYHWDLPQELEDSMGGWLNFELVPLFARFAETCFTAFGDRVKNWVTVNEPNIAALFGYGIGMHAPGRCSPPICSHGNSSTEPYIVAHNMLLAHAAVSEIYKKNFQATQGGVIGIAVEASWWEPYSSSLEDIAAAERAMNFEFGWFLDPIYFGDYPSSMRERVKELPTFTKEQQLSLLNSTDFLGLNHYTSAYAADSTSEAVIGSDYVPNPNVNGDSGVIKLVKRGGVLVGPKEAFNGWLYNVPWGFRKLTNYAKERYNNPEIIILENGMEQFSNQTIDDSARIEFYQDYLSNLLAAIRDGANVKGYFAWTLLDGWEWSRGYAYNFGFYFVDYKDNLKRYPKESAKWFTSFLNHTCQESSAMHASS